MYTPALPLTDLLPSFLFFIFGKKEETVGQPEELDTQKPKKNPLLMICIILLVTTIIVAYFYFNHNEKPVSVVHGVEIEIPFSVPKNLPSVNASSLEEKESRALQIIEKIRKSIDFNPTDEELLFLMEVARETNNEELRALILSIIGTPVAMLAEMFAEGLLDIQDEFSVEVVLFWLIHLGGLDTEAGISFFVEQGGIINEMAQNGNILAQQVEELMASTANLIQSIFKPGFSDKALVTFEEMARLVLKLANEVELAANEAEDIVRRFREFVREEGNANNN